MKVLCIKATHFIEVYGDREGDNEHPTCTTILPISYLREVIEQTNNICTTLKTICIWHIKLKT